LAPLKLESFTLPGNSIQKFPRPNGLGPIEAYRGFPYSAFHVKFPRPNGLGPIEAYVLLVIAENLFRFPRPNGLGPIEANLLGSIIFLRR